MLAPPPTPPTTTGSQSLWQQLSVKLLHRVTTTTIRARRSKCIIITVGEMETPITRPGFKLMSCVTVCVCVCVSYLHLFGEQSHEALGGSTPHHHLVASSQQPLRERAGEVARAKDAEERVSGVGQRGLQAPGAASSSFSSCCCSSIISD